MESTDSPEVGLQQLLDIATGFWRSQVLFSAVECGVFGALVDGPATLAELQERTGLHERAARDLLDSLGALGLLLREGDRYRNAPVTERHLDRKQPGYVGGFLMFMSKSLYPAWGRLPELLRTGHLQEGDDSFGAFYRDPDRVRGCMSAMDSAAAAITAELVKWPDWQRYQSFVDLGGARGNLAGRIALAHPHLKGGCFDLPPLEPFFTEHMTSLDTADRVVFHGGDFRSDPLPEADVLLFGHVLHDWDEDARRALVARAHAALRPGGSLLVYDELIDDDRGGPARSLLMSLNMQLVRSGASEYSAAEAREWLAEAGFTEVGVQELTATERLIVARKAD